jgi:hypothetical protein
MPRAYRLRDLGLREVLDRGCSTDVVKRSKQTANRSRTTPPKGRPGGPTASSSERRGTHPPGYRRLIQGVPIIGVHVTTGLVDECRTSGPRLEPREREPCPSSTIATIIAVKQRHVAFFW